MPYRDRTCPRMRFAQHCLPADSFEARRWAELAPHDDGSSTSTIGNMIAVRRARHRWVSHDSPPRGNAPAICKYVQRGGPRCPNRWHHGSGRSIVFDSLRRWHDTSILAVCMACAVLVAGAYVSMNLALATSPGLNSHSSSVAGVVGAHLHLPRPGHPADQVDHVGRCQPPRRATGHELVQQAPTSPPSPPPSPPVRKRRRSRTP